MIGGAIIFLLFITTLLIKAFNDNCLIYSSSKIDCQVCKYGYYLIRRSSNNMECEKKIYTNEAINKRVFVSPRPISQIINSGTIIYNNLAEAIAREEKELAKFSSSYGIFLEFRLMKGDHYIFPKDLLVEESAIPSRNNFEMQIVPHYCQGVEDGYCYNESESAVIFVKTQKFSFIVRKKLSLENITFNGVDLNIEFIEGSGCADEEKLCCKDQIQEECLLRSIQNSNSSSHSLKGLFSLEPLLEDYTVPQLTFRNLKFLGMDSRSNFFSLIALSQLGGSFSMFNTTFEKCFFPRGLITSKLEISSFELDTASQIQTSSVIAISYSTIENYNYLTENFKIEVRKMGLSYSPMFDFEDFVGSISFTLSTINNTELSLYGFIKIKNRLGLDPVFVHFIGNAFHMNNFDFLFFFLDGFKGESIFVEISGNVFKNNQFNEFIKLIHVRNFVLSGKFSKGFEFPMRSFIIAEYSNFSIINAEFTDIISSKLNSCFIRITSDYSFTSKDIYDYAKSTKVPTFANDTTLIINCSFINTNVYLYEVFKFNYQLTIEKSIFKSITLNDSDTYAFISVSPEALFLIKEVNFKNIFSKSKVIFAPLFLKASLESILISDVFLYDSSFFHFNSLTYSDPSGHYIVFARVNFENIFVHTTTGNFICLFILVCFETGRGSAMNVENITVNNISYNIPRFWHQLFRITNTLLTVKSLITYNISYCVLLAHLPRTSSTTLFIRDIVFNNPGSNELQALIECEMAYFTNATLINSLFINANIKNNIGIRFGLARKVYVSNVKLELLQESGCVLTANVQNLNNFFAENISIKTGKGSRACLVTLSMESNETNFNIVDYENLYQRFVNGTINNFGIVNSIFESSYYGAISLPFAGRILIVNSTFLKNNAPEGSIVRLAQQSLAILFLCQILQSKASVFGGSFYVDQSVLLLFKVTVNFTMSALRGGGLYILSSFVVIKESVVENAESIAGGVIFSDENSEIILVCVHFLNSLTKLYGGHIVSKTGSLKISNSKLMQGQSLFYGGALYLESVYFEIINSQLANNSCLIGTIYLINANDKNISLILQSELSNNFAEKNGAIIFSDNFNLNLTIIDLNKNEAKASGYCIYFQGTFVKPTLYISYLKFYNNSAVAGILCFIEGGLHVDTAFFFQNKFENSSFLYSVNANVTINRSFISLNKSTAGTNKKYEAPSNGNFFIILGKFTNISIFSSLFKLDRMIALMSCVFCEYVSVGNSEVFNGFSGKLGVFSVKDSNLFGRNLLLLNNSGPSGAVYATNTNINFEFVVFSLNRAEKNGSDISFLMADAKNLRKNINLKFCLFPFIEGVSTSIIQGGSISFDLCLFSGNTLDKSNAVSLIDVEGLEILNSEFTNFVNDSAVILGNKEGHFPTSLKIQNCYFSNASYQTGSGAFLYLSGLLEVLIVNSSFSCGNSKAGGAIYFACSLAQCFMKILNSIFYNNSASVKGGAILSQNNNVSILNCSYKKNEAPMGSDLIFFPNKTLIFKIENELDQTGECMAAYLNGNMTTGCYLINDKEIDIKPGEFFSLGFVIVDKLNNIQTSETTGAIKISVAEEIGKLQHKLSDSVAKVSDGIAILNRVKLIGITNVFITIKVNYKRGNYNLVDKFYVNVIKCNRGEAFQDFQCVLCGPKYYSLSYFPEELNQSCELCVPNADCRGGFEVIPDNTYWRKDANSSIIVRCKNKKGCAARTPKNYKPPDYLYECAEGYEGNLCEACERGFGFVKNECIRCDKKGKLFFAIFFVVGCLTYLFYVYYQENHFMVNSPDHDVTLMKIFVNYVSVFVLLTALKVDWSNIFKDFFAVFSTFASTSPSSIFSIECFFEWDANEKVWYNFFIISLSPIALAILSLGFSYLLRQVKKRLFEKGTTSNKMKHQIIFKDFKVIWIEFSKNLVFIFFNLYPHILVNIFNVFSCRSLDNNTEDLYLVHYPWINCSSDFYFKIRLVATLFLCSWAIFFTFILVYVLTQTNKGKLKVFVHFSKQNSKSYRESLKEARLKSIRKSSQIMRNFIEKGYQKQFFWWEAVIFFRKMSFLCIATFSEEMDAVSIGGATLLALSLFLIINLIYKPYSEKFLNIMEEFSLLVSAVTIAMGVISIDSEIGYYFSVSCSIILIVSNVLFIASCAVLFLGIVFKDCMPAFREKWNQVFGRVRAGSKPLKNNIVNDGATPIKKDNLFD